MEAPSHTAVSAFTVGIVGLGIVMRASGAMTAVEVTSGASVALAADDVTGIGVADDILIPVVAAIGAATVVYLLTSYALSEGDSGVEYDDPARNPAQDKPLSKGEIRKLKEAGKDIHDIKGGENTGPIDLYKDAKGNVYIKPKGNKGYGEPAYINLNNL